MILIISQDWGSLDPMTYQVLLVWNILGYGSPGLPLNWSCQPHLCRKPRNHFLTTWGIFYNQRSFLASPCPFCLSCLQHFLFLHKSLGIREQEIHLGLICSRCGLRTSSSGVSRELVRTTNLSRTGSDHWSSTQWHFGII